MAARDLMYGLTADRLRGIVRYDVETGLFFHRRKVNQVDISKPTGWLNKNGYRMMNISGRKYMVHRLVWLFETGEWPPAEIDHIDGDRSNNRFCNLRPASAAQNARNKKPAKNNFVGVKGVQLHETGRYRARIFVDGRNRSLGLYDTVEQARAAYEAAAAKHFGEFARAS